jgi:transposase
MDRATEMKIGQALNEAIWLRDNVEKLGPSEIEERIKDLGKYELFSARQLSAICNGAISHHLITKLIGKTDRTGGNLNVGTLDILRSILLNRASSGTDYALISDAVGMGTSQGMVAKLTGVSQGSISKKIRRKNG